MTKKFTHRLGAVFRLMIIIIVWTGLSYRLTTAPSTSVLAGCDSSGCSTSLICNSQSVNVSCQQDCSPANSGCYDGQGRPVAGTAQMTGYGCQPEPYVNCANVCNCGGGGGDQPKATPTPPPASCAGSCGIVPGANGTSGCKNPIEVRVDRENNKITLDWGCSYDWSDHPIWSGLKIYDEGLNRWNVGEYATKLEFTIPYQEYLDQNHTFTIYPRCESGDPPVTACRRSLTYKAEPDYPGNDDNTPPTPIPSPTPYPTQSAPPPNPDVKLELIDAEAHSFNGFNGFMVRNQEAISLLSLSAPSQQIIIDSQGLGPPVFEAVNYTHQAVAYPDWFSFEVLKKALTSSNKTKAVITLSGQSEFNMAQVASAIKHSRNQAGVVLIEGNLNINSLPTEAGRFILLTQGSINISTNSSLEKPILAISRQDITVNPSVSKITGLLVTDSKIIFQPKAVQAAGVFFARGNFKINPDSQSINYSFRPEPALLVKLINQPLFSHRLFSIFSAKESQPGF